MATRGLWGFVEIEGRKDNLKQFAVYHSHDSYPIYLGYYFFNSIKRNGITAFDKFAKDVKVVVDKSSNDYICKNISIENIYYTEDIYTTLQKMDITVVDSFEFIKDSLFCEWAYFINLKHKTIEIYKGFNTDPTEAGDYAKEKVTINDKYYGCRFLIDIPIELINQWDDNEIKRFLYNFEFLSDILSIKNYEYLPEDKQVQNAFDDTKQFFDIIQKIPEEKRETIKEIVIKIVSESKSETRNKIRPTINFIKRFPPSDLFIYAFSIFLSDNDKSKNILNILKQIEQFNPSFHKQLKNIHRQIYKKHPQILYNTFFDIKTNLKKENINKQKKV